MEVGIAIIKPQLGITKAICELKNSPLILVPGPLEETQRQPETESESHSLTAVVLYFIVTHSITAVL